MCVTPVLAHGTHPSQNGFVKGRQLLQNVVDLDTCARIYGMLTTDKIKTQSEADALWLAILVFFDFCAAFPSVAHLWIFIVLESSGAPQWFVNFVRALYSSNNTYHMNSFGKTFLFAFLSGVLQGCLFLPLCSYSP